MRALSCPVRIDKSEPRRGDLPIPREQQVSILFIGKSLIIFC
ncbi:Uncharacterized protein dnm_078600 [Desulfonema magnum]|uniref:Uncharacterized protein n=1 Tax=Desulfonema magnum TaxID=45655 RepID=A0A975BU39_9BACT|nr:Uncharacterized protein dnm_078600 [Desulfonema magnum]